MKKFKQPLLIAIVCNICLLYMITAIKLVCELRLHELNEFTVILFMFTSMSYAILGLTIKNTESDETKSTEETK